MGAILEAGYKEEKQRKIKSRMGLLLRESRGQRCKRHISRYKVFVMF